MALTLALYTAQKTCLHNCIGGIIRAYAPHSHSPSSNPILILAQSPSAHLLQVTIQVQQLCARLGQHPGHLWRVQHQLRQPEHLHKQMESTDMPGVSDRMCCLARLYQHAVASERLVKSQFGQSKLGATGIQHKPNVDWAGVVEDSATRTCAHPK